MIAGIIHNTQPLKEEEGGKKMKRLCALAVGVLLSVSLVAAVNAAPEKTTGNPQAQQGEKGGKKAMEAKREREKKVREVKKQALTKRQQALYGK
uniref:Uncharacterized protein n=1 Tax=Geobacter metallireducens TaxID=28232 RepID=A0A831UCV8_GEOME